MTIHRMSPLLRRGTADEWATSDPILNLGEFGVETDEDGSFIIEKCGDGVTPWSLLPDSSSLTRQAQTFALEYLADEEDNQLVVPAGALVLPDFTDRLSILYSTLDVESFPIADFADVLGLPDPSPAYCVPPGMTGLWCLQASVGSIDPTGEPPTTGYLQVGYASGSDFLDDARSVMGVASAPYCNIPVAALTDDGLFNPFAPSWIVPLVEGDPLSGLLYSEFDADVSVDYRFTASFLSSVAPVVMDEYES